MLTEAEQRELDELELMELDALEASYQQEDSEPAVTEELEPETGFLENTLMGAGERVGDLVGNIGGTIDDAAGYLREKTGGEYRVGYNLRGKDSGFDAGWFTADEVEKQGRIGKLVEDVMTNADFGYESRYNVDKLLESEGFGDTLENTFGTILEQGIVSAPDMAALIISAPAYLLSRSQELSNERAINNGRDEPTAEDRMIGSTGAVVSILIDKIGLGALQAKNLAGSFAKNLAKKIGAEASTEAIQEDIEYAATNLGTKAGATWEEAGKAALGGALGGAGIGGAFGAVTETGAALDRRTLRKARQADAKVKSDAKLAEKMEGVKQADAINAELLGQGTNRQAFIDTQVETGTVQTPVQAADIQRQVDIEAAAIASGQGARASNLIPDVPIVSPVTMPTEGEPGFIRTPVEEAIVEEVIDTPFKEQTTTKARTNQQEIDAAFQEGARSGGIGGTITPDADLVQEFRKEETAVKREAQDTKIEVVSRKLQRKQARAQRVLDDPKSSDEAVDRAEELLVEADEETSIAVAKQREQEVKRRKEDLVEVKEGFLASDRKVAGRKKNELIQIAESLGLDVQPAKGKKSVSVPQYREAIASHPDVVIADVKPTANVLDAAFKPIVQEEVVEAPVVAPKPVTEVTPTPTITEEADTRPALTLDVDGVTVIDRDGMPVDQSPKVRARFFKKIGKADPELLEEGDRGLTDLQKAEKRLRSLEYQDQAQTEQGGLTPKQVTEKDKLVAKIEKLRKNEVEAVAKKAAEETVRVEQETTTAPEGMAVEGQAEVDVVEDTTSLEDIDSPFEDDSEIIMSADEALNALQERMDKAQDLKRCINA